jgi:hypothetical protein
MIKALYDHVSEKCGLYLDEMVVFLKVSSRLWLLPFASEKPL